MVRIQERGRLARCRLPCSGSGAERHVVATERLDMFAAGLMAGWTPALREKNRHFGVVK